MVYLKDVLTTFTQTFVIQVNFLLVCLFITSNCQLVNFTVIV